MITTDLTGNLGNHLFQYALCRTIAEKRGFEWGINPVPYGDYYNGVPQMDFLNIHYGKQIEGIQREHKEQRIHISDTPGGADWWQYEPNLIDEVENNTKITGAWQTEKYFLNNKENIKKWYTVKEEPNISHLMDDNTCVINIRGGEYRGYQELVLQPVYFRNAMEIVKKHNPNVRFIVVTDDVPFAHAQLGLPTYHQTMAIDWYMINKAKWLILSNSSFAWFPAWLNDKCNIIIAPKYWGRHNVSDGYWASSDIFTKGWMYLSKEGHLYNYDEVIEEIAKSKYSSLKGNEL